MSSKNYDASGVEKDFNPFFKEKVTHTDTSHVSNVNNISYVKEPPKQISSKVNSQFKNLNTSKGFQYKSPAPSYVPPLPVPVARTENMPIPDTRRKTSLFRKNTLEIEKTTPTIRSNYTLKKLELPKKLEQIPSKPVIARDPIITTSKLFPQVPITQPNPKHVLKPIKTYISSEKPIEDEQDVLIEDSGEPDTTIKSTPFESNMESNDLDDIPLTQITENSKKEKNVDYGESSTEDLEPMVEEKKDKPKDSNLKISNEKLKEKIDKASESIIDTSTKIVDYVLKNSSESIRKDVQKFIGKDTIPLKRKISIPNPEESAKKLSKIEENPPIVSNPPPITTPIENTVTHPVDTPVPIPTNTPINPPFILQQVNATSWVLYMSRDTDAKLLIRFQ
jgi:hypothetical protein